MFATITAVLQYRRISVFALGVWMGAALFADIAVTQNFQTVDRFLNDPGTSAAAQDLQQIGRARERALLRRNAAEENNFLFINAERAQIGLALLVILLLAFELQPSSSALLISLALAVIVLVQHFVLSPQIAELGRAVDALPPSDPVVRRFWLLHGVYSGAEILKLLAGAVLALRLCTGSTRQDAAYA